ncbi:hypothetical protein Mapa_007647 [Marchantia paleacea]|nr:hypothetical protein Mapa_007647 [Marchantia paleacea]
MWSHWSVCARGFVNSAAYRILRDNFVAFVIRLRVRGSMEVSRCGLRMFSHPSTRRRE